MSLASLKFPSRVHPVGDDSITVYGLSTPDIAGIIAAHMGDIEVMFDIFEEHGVKTMADLKNVDLGLVGRQILAQLPGLMSTVIAYAAHEPDQAEAARQIPSPLQLKILIDIFTLTFHDETSFREFVGNVVAVLRKARSAAAPLPESLDASDSPNGGSE